MAQALANATHAGKGQEGSDSGLKSIVSVIKDPLRSLLLLRFLLFNLFAFALLGVAWSQGYVAKVIAADQTYLCVVIFAVFLVGLIIAARKVWQTNEEIDAINSSDGLNASAIQPLVYHLVTLPGMSE